MSDVRQNQIDETGNDDTKLKRNVELLEDEGARPVKKKKSCDPPYKNMSYPRKRFLGGLRSL